MPSDLTPEQRMDLLMDAIRDDFGDAAFPGFSATDIEAIQVRIVDAITAVEGRGYAKGGADAAAACDADVAYYENHEALSIEKGLATLAKTNGDCAYAAKVCAKACRALSRGKGGE